MPTPFLQGYLGDYAPPFGGGDGGGASWGQGRGHHNEKSLHILKLNAL